MSVPDEHDLNDLIRLELAHTIWFQQKGKNITDMAALHEAWRVDNEAALRFAQELVQSLYRRGMMISIFDRSLSQFARET